MSYATFTNENYKIWKINYSRDQLDAPSVFSFNAPLLSATTADFYVLAGCASRLLEPSQCDYLLDIKEFGAT